MNFIDRTAEFDPQDAQTNKVMGILAYIGPLVFVPMFAAKESTLARFHANQGLILFILEMAASILGAVFANIPWIGWLIALPFYAVEVVSVVCAIMGIVAASKGQAKEFPIIGGIKILK